MTATGLVFAISYYLLYVEAAIERYWLAALLGATLVWIGYRIGCARGAAKTRPQAFRRFEEKP